MPKSARARRNQQTLFMVLGVMVVLSMALSLVIVPTTTRVEPPSATSVPIRITIAPTQVPTVSATPTPILTPTLTRTPTP
jgi:hypothetical protein